MVGGKEFGKARGDFFEKLGGTKQSAIVESFFMILGSFMPKKPPIEGHCHATASTRSPLLGKHEAHFASELFNRGRFAW